MSLSIESLYDEYAEAYSAIAFDRDFMAEIRQICHLAQRNKRVNPKTATLLELFAGPAWHCSHWREAYGGRAIAIDSSAAMRQLAVQNGHVEPSNYLVSRLPMLPDWPADLGPSPHFDIVLALRYSIGYLDPHSLVCLLSQLRATMVPGSVVVLELHRPEFLETDFASLKIRTRSASLVDGTMVECDWPAGPIKWTTDRLVAAMPVSFTFRQPHSGANRCIEFVSMEYAYLPIHIENACRSAGGRFNLEDWTAEIAGVFPSSTVLALRSQ